MPDTIIVHLAQHGLLPERLRKTKIGMSDHAENAGDIPVHERFSHHIGDCSRTRRFRRHPDINAVVANLHRVHFLSGVFMSARWLTS